MKILAALLAACLTGTPVFASECEKHVLGNISGTDIDMKVYDHAFAGAIKDFIAWGFVDEAKGGAELILRKYGQRIRTEFGRKKGKFGGVIESGEGKAARRTDISLVKANGKKKRFRLSVAGEEVLVTISPKRMDGHHFIDPTYTAKLKGKTVRYTVEGMACMGLSIQYAMMILGAYAH